jgi:Holliday junction DNA helicase RuvA
MYAFIKGKLIHAAPASVIVETAGIGYKIIISTSVFAKLPQIEQELMLHTSFVIRENSQALYGFLSLHERDLFEVLLGISGIGPKTALNLTGHLPIHDFHRAVSNNEIALICKVPGVGKKTAERLIIEMRDKLSNMFPIDPSDLSITITNQAFGTTVKDAMSALINLGYNQAIAQKALKKTLSDLPEGIDLGTMITTALKNI